MKSKKLTMGLMIFYLLALTWVIIFKLSLSFEDLPSFRSLNLIPFGAPTEVNGRADFGEMFQNLLVFIPFGLFISALWPKKPFWQKALPIVATSLFYETAQYIFAIGGSDITDLIANSAGGIIGLGIGMFFYSRMREKWTQTLNIISLAGGGALTLFIAFILIYNMKFLMVK